MRSSSASAAGPSAARWERMSASSSKGSATKRRAYPAARRADDGRKREQRDQERKEHQAPLSKTATASSIPHPTQRLLAPAGDAEARSRIRDERAADTEEGDRQEARGTPSRTPSRRAHRGSGRKATTRAAQRHPREGSAVPLPCGVHPHTPRRRAHPPRTQPGGVSITNRAASTRGTRTLRPAERLQIRSNSSPVRRQAQESPGRNRRGW